MVCFGLHIVDFCKQHRIQHRIRHRMRCSFDWIWSGVQGVQITCTIAQAQEFACQCIHSGIDRPTSGRRSRAIAAAESATALGSGGRGNSCSGGRGSRFLLLFIPRHGEALGVNGFTCGNVHRTSASWRGKASTSRCLPPPQASISYATYGMSYATILNSTS